MAATDGRSPADLKSIQEDLLADPARYSFFQSIRLLSYFFQKQYGMDAAERFLKDNLRVRPQLSLSFPGTDIVDISRESAENGHDLYHLTATFLGLYGASSPLPTWYTEDLLDEATEDSSVTRDFLDIINIPFYPLLAQAWSKYRLFMQVAGKLDAENIQRLYCLLGYGLPELRHEVSNMYRMPRYIGLFTQWPRSATGLKTLISDALGGIPVKVVPNIIRKVKIPHSQRLHVGVQGHQLGEDAYLGEELSDRMTRFRLVIGPVDDEKYHACLPDSSKYSWVRELTRLYLLNPLDCVLTLRLKNSDARPAQLGANKWSQLGYDTWVFSQKPPERPEAVFHMNLYEVHT
ncbi:type VI secretion system baseplate subunit TssG [Desulfovibrio inopinatus]|uniref:type VI secretion system baseplate subunit TssG n=1 Tax=Desulfovibrio inopinatus TaxID=102109 RepID=UPI0003FFF1FD|nr:type VI secretion system baseplate subunit TssG [Desulfovibrio inopinatus]